MLNQVVHIIMMGKLCYWIFFKIKGDERHIQSILRILYHLSIDDRVKAMFTFTDSLPKVSDLVYPAIHGFHYFCIYCSRPFTLLNQLMNIRFLFFNS